jgi:hypothetical protein
MEWDPRGHLGHLVPGVSKILLIRATAQENRFHNSGELRVYREAQTDIPDPLFIPDKSAWPRFHANCHKGRGVGGGPEFAKFGVVSQYWKATGSWPIDHGRFENTKNEQDRYMFKVPGLCNVAMTPPYFHDGAALSLRKAVCIMATVQLGIDLSDSEVDEITAFLGSLTGKLPEGFERAPVLPVGGFVPPSAGSPPIPHK